MKNVLKAIEHRPLAIVAGFIILDVLGYLLYSLYLDGTLNSRFFRLGRDRGYFELLEYAKMGVIILILHSLYQRSQASIFKAWLWLFAVLLVDNMLEIHEAIGDWKYTRPSGS